jgi:hypothetical protein
MVVHILVYFSKSCEYECASWCPSGQIGFDSLCVIDGTLDGQTWCWNALEEKPCK